MGAASGGMSKNGEHSCLCMLNENYEEDEDNKWIICSSCSKWYHHKCNLLSDEEYEEILNSNKDWFCSDYKCQEKQSNSLQQERNEVHVPLVSSPEQIKKKIRSRMSRKCKEKKMITQTIDVYDSPSSCVDSQPVDDSQNNDILVPCLLCKDNKLYKKKGGLKIHCKRKHKDEDYSIMFEDVSNIKKFDVNSLSDKIGYYKRNVRVIKRIPKGARMLAGYELAKKIEKTVSQNDSSSWEELLFFAYKSFRVPDNNKKNLTKVVKNNINNDDTIPSFKKYSRKQATLSKRVESKVAEGDLRGAVKLLSSSEGLALENEETYLKLLNKHPKPSRILDFPEIPKDLPCLVVDEKKVSEGIFSFPFGSASGIDGLSPQHLKYLIAKSNGEASTKLLEALTKLTNLMLSGEVNEDILSIIYGANLCALTKNESDVRPIAVGCCYRRLTSKLACRSEFKQASEFLFPKQVGVATEGGCEAAIHSVRTFISHNSGSKKVMVKVDLKNAFNSLERDDLDRKSVV